MDVRASGRFQLTIVTPVSRPQNIPAVLASVLAAPKPSILWLRWLLVLDGRKVPAWPVALAEELARYDFVRCEINSSPGIGGNSQRNWAIELMESGFLYFLDDDNLLHERLLEALVEERRRWPNCGGFMFHQRSRKNRRNLRALRANVRPGAIDTGQFVVHRDVIGNVRWEPFHPCADGTFIRAVYQANSDRFRFVDEVLCYYNELR
jgi:hypothetical protein